MVGSLRCVQTLTRWPGRMRLIGMVQWPSTASTISSRRRRSGQLWLRSSSSMTRATRPCPSVMAKSTDFVPPAQSRLAQGWIALDDLDRIRQTHLRTDVVAAGQVRLDFHQGLQLPR